MKLADVFYYLGWLSVVFILVFLLKGELTGFFVSAGLLLFFVVAMVVSLYKQAK
jgi:hypothetical protein